CPFSLFILLPPARSTLFPYTTLFRSDAFDLLDDSSSTEIVFSPVTSFASLSLRIATKDGCLITPSDVISVYVTSQMSSGFIQTRSEEHTSELQSRENLVCRLLLEKKK